MLSVIINSARVIIIVTPFRTLINDIVIRFRENRINYREWRYSKNNTISIVIVSIDITVSYSFLSYT